MLNLWSRAGKDFVADRRGIASVEFATVLPILMLLFMGMVDGTKLMQAQRKVVHVSRSIADLVAQEPVLTDSLLADLFIAADLIIAPFPTDELGVTIKGIRFDVDNGNPYLDFEEVLRTVIDGEMPSRAGAMAEPGGGIVFVQASFRFQPLFASVFTGDITISEGAYARPRRSSYVLRDTES